MWCRCQCATAGDGAVRCGIRTRPIVPDADTWLGKGPNRAAFEKWADRQQIGINRLTYAHIEVLVTFLLVKIFGFWVIARYPTMRF